MDQRLINVTEAGDVDALYALLGQDQYILEGIDVAPFVDTPLHLAVQAQKTAFAVEIANLKPSFARKLNHGGFSPIHLASTNGQLKIIHELLEIDHDLCLLPGREKRIPLHFAAMAGETDVMVELLRHCPVSIEKLTFRGETPLHLAAKNGQLEGCKLLLEWIKILNKREVVNWKDEDDKTALEVAGSPEVVDLLVTENNTNLLAQERRLSNLDIIGEFLFSVDKESTKDVRNALLVVTALIVTTTFQAGLSPPGGVWQENSDITTTFPSVNQPAHYAGQAIMGIRLFNGFAFVNTVGFCSSLILIGVLTMKLSLQPLLLASLASMFFTYMVSMSIVSPGESNLITVTLVAFILAMLELAAWYYHLYFRKLKR